MTLILRYAFVAAVGLSLLAFAPLRCAKSSNTRSIPHAKPVNLEIWKFGNLEMGAV